MQELILFSRADLERSIPCMVDGLKPGQRKILFSCFKRNLKTDIKVAQLAGYVSEHSAYHHGEQSLASTIIGLAQDFVGSNNINLLVPSGQFGTRLQVIFCQCGFGQRHCLLGLSQYSIVPGLGCVLYQDLALAARTGAAKRRPRTYIFAPTDDLYHRVARMRPAPVTSTPAWRP